jgi:hypothetical protein
MYRMRFMVLVGVVAASAGLCVRASDQSLQLTTDANSVWILAGKSPILQYRYDGVPFKPYMRELYTPSGVNFLLDAPSDHLHHHALMYAVAVDGVNFWEETPGSGYQVHDKLDNVRVYSRDGAAYAEFGEKVRWMPSRDRPCLLMENRQIQTCRVPSVNATVVTWRSGFWPPKGTEQVTLSGSHYFGLGLRFVRSMDGSEFFNADGKEGTVFRGEERLVQSNWCAYTAAVDGKPVTVAMFGHPANPRPTTWFTMAKPFAYISATLNLHAEPLVVPAGKAFGVQYAVAAWDGKVGPEQIDSVYRWFAGKYSPVSTSREGVDGYEKDE